MPSLKDLKNRIESVKSTRKITSAMKMVAAATIFMALVILRVDLTDSIRFFRSLRLGMPYVPVRPRRSF